MKNRIAATVVALAVVVGGAAVALPANAVEAPPSYVIALWEASPNLEPKFPQTLVGSQETNSTDVHALDALAVKCGTTYQADLYANDEKTATLIAAAILTGSHDESWPGGSYSGAYSNVFTTAACVEEEPTPEAQVCTVTGNWYTEDDDVAPVQTDAGLRFVGSKPVAVGYRIPVTGNLQGFQDTTFATDVEDSKFYFRLVIDSTVDGGWSYQSLTLAGVSPITGASVAYSNKVGASKTLDEWAALYPNNQITSIGFQTDTQADTSTDVTLLSTSGCISASFVPGVEPTPPTQVKTGDLSPLMPWVPVGLLLLVASGVIAVRLRTI